MTNYSEKSIIFEQVQYFARQQRGFLLASDGTQFTESLRSIFGNVFHCAVTQHSCHWHPPTRCNLRAYLVQFDHRRVLNVALFWFFNNYSATGTLDNNFTVRTGLREAARGLSSSTSSLTGSVSCRGARLTRVSRRAAYLCRFSSNFRRIFSLNSASLFLRANSVED